MRHIVLRLCKSCKVLCVSGIILPININRPQILYSLTDLSDVEMDLALCNQIVPFPRRSSVARRNRLWQSFTMPAPGIASTILVGFLGLLFLLCRKGRIRKARVLELLAASAGGLLSSSCCAVQVLLNTFSIGCAGFAALDHLRPFFILLTFSSLIYKTIVYDLRTYKQLWRSSPSWLVAVILTMFPTIMRHLNRGMGLRELIMLSGSLPCENKAASPTVILQYKVEGMKCEACANGLKLALQALQSDVRARVFYEKGIVFLIRTQKGADQDVETARDLERGVAQVMKERGYRCRLERTALSL